jgi:hypothetical protein
VYERKLRKQMMSDNGMSSSSSSRCDRKCDKNEDGLSAPEGSENGHYVYVIIINEQQASCFTKVPGKIIAMYSRKHTFSPVLLVQNVMFFPQKSQSFPLGKVPRNHSGL